VWGRGGGYDLSLGKPKPRIMLLAERGKEVPSIWVFPPGTPAV